MDHIQKPKRKIHPKEKANVIVDVLFLYAFKLYRKGFKKEIEEDDLYEVHSKYKSEKLGNQLENAWEKQKKTSNQSSLTRLLWKLYGPYYLCLGLCELIIKSSILILKPYGIGKVVLYFDPSQTTLTRRDACLYAIFVISLNFFECIYQHNYYLRQILLGIKVRTAFCSFIYRKALKISPAHLGDISVGKIVTLITKDVHAFESFIDFFNDIWISIIRTGIVCFVLYKRIGIAALVGVGVFVIIMPFQIYCGSQATKMKLKMCKKTDERLQVTQETLSAIRIIKMYTWEKIFDSKITDARKKEIRTTYNIFFLKFMVVTIGGLTSHIAFYLMIATYIYLGNAVTAEIIYFVMTCFHSMSHNLCISFPIGVYQTAELVAAVKRIGNVVKTLEIDTDEPKYDTTILPKIVLKNASASIRGQKIIDGISLKVEKGLTLVTGNVGSGKSFLLKTILQDYKLDEGSVVVQGRISYASQEPWLFPSSIRQNILFGETYDEKRYHEVLKVCALIYDFDLLKSGDQTIVEDRGINLSRGQQARINLARAIYKESEIYLLDDCLSALDAHVSSFIFEDCVKKFLKEKLVILVTHNLSYSSNADNIVVMHNGTVRYSGAPSQINNSDFDVPNTTSNDVSKVVNNDKLDDDVDDEEAKLITETTTEKKVYQEVKKTGEVNFGIYNKYLKFGGGFFAAFIIIAVFAIAQFIVSYTDKLVSVWVNLEKDLSNYKLTYNSTNTTEYESMYNKKINLFYMYTIMTVATAVTTFGRAVVLLLFGKRAALKLHRQMITTVINATMRFFDMNFIGNILNRFSKDLINVDELLPFAFYHVLRVFFILVGVVTLIASVNTMFLIPAAVFFTTLIILRQCVLRTTRNLKRLDASTRSPMIGHLNATLEGLTTIRAFKAEDILKLEFDRHQDLYTSANFILQSSMRAFQFTLDTLCSVFIASIVLKFFIFDDGTLAGNVGLAISQAFMLTGTLQWGIRQWAEIENQMTSVERVIEYTEVTKENKQGQDIENWPKRGEVKYENVYLSYNNTEEYVLKKINFDVTSKQKIGIVGRTGAGKSSIISTLFRLYEVKGKISIDGVDTKTLSLEHLRSNISIIPQDPVLFSGTVRHNIDPREEYSDEEVWKAIETAHLKPLIPALDFEIKENGANFSVGQRQLICLARAVARNNKIIVLDEATANMDQDTDALIHETIQKNFLNCTVFTIAHKLHSIVHCDKVMVLDRGEIAEYDNPRNLLNNQQGLFYNMVKKSGLLYKFM